MSGFLPGRRRDATEPPGVKIVFGTDVGGFAWTEPIAQEFDRMVSFGMTPMDAIRSATSRAAEMLGATNDLGVIAPGAYADIIAVAADPLRDIHALHNVSFVMKNGEVVRR
jgi:imidazolonepropionase-like amidohydrolase